MEKLEFRPVKYLSGVKPLGVSKIFYAKDEANYGYYDEREYHKEYPVQVFVFQVTDGPKEGLWFWSVRKHNRFVYGPYVYDLDMRSFKENRYAKGSSVDGYKCYSDAERDAVAGWRHAVTLFDASCSGNFTMRDWHIEQEHQSHLQSRL